MNLILWLLIGALIGWGASIVMRQPQAVLMDVAVGIIGALAAGIVFLPVFGASLAHPGTWRGADLLISLLGAVTLSVIVHLFRRGTAS